MKTYHFTLFTLAALALPASAALTTPFIYNGHGYVIDNAGVTWDAANTAASGLTGGSGGIPAGWSNPHLVTINTSAENAEVLSQLQSAGISTTAGDGGGGTYAWIGGQETTEGNYQWTNGTDFWSGGSGGSAVGGAYTNWGSYTADFGGGPTTTNEPDNFNGTQNRAAISTTGWPVGNPFVTSPASAGQWNDVNDTDNLAFVVEFDIVPEPSSIMLLGLGALAGLTRRRR